LAARGLLHRTARILGSNLAGLVSFFNPDLLVLGGGIARAEDLVLPALEQALRSRALPLATQGLRICMSTLAEEVAGVTGAVHLALDQVLSADHLPGWLSAGE